MKRQYSIPTTAPVITVSLVPIHGGDVVAFEVTAREARGVWLPWTTLEFGQSPWESASILADEWCDGHEIAIDLVDAISILDGDAWQLAIVFRARLAALPSAKADRVPVAAHDHGDSLCNPFSAADVSRWAQAPVPARERSVPLVF